MAGEMIERIREVEGLAKEKENAAIARSNKIIERAKEEARTYVLGVREVEETLRKQELNEAEKQRIELLEKADSEAKDVIGKLEQLKELREKETINYIVKEVLHSVSA